MYIYTLTKHVRFEQQIMSQRRSQRRSERGSELCNELYVQVIHAQNIEDVRSVLVKGADPNYPQIDDHFYTTPLHAAAGLSGATYMALLIPVEKIDLLIEWKCDVNILDQQGQTALMIACRSHLKMPVVSKLLSLDANTNIISKHGETALNVAAAHGSDEMVALLIAKGANANARVSRYMPGYDSDDEATHLGVIENPICGACDRFHDEPTVAAILLERDANPNQLSRFHKTPLSLATTRKYPLTVELLLKSRADPNMHHRDSSNDAPILICAAKHQDTRIAEMLLDYKADPNVQLQFKYKPLCAAVARCNLEMVELLVQHQADLFARNEAGRTALQVAVIESRLATKENGRTAPEVAADVSRHAAVEDYLRQRVYEVRMLAASMAMHPRLGSESIMRNMHGDVMRDQLAQWVRK